jgi:Tfp pilus assembly protein PilV
MTVNELFAIILGMKSQGGRWQLRAGLSMLETVIALVMLTASFLVFFRLFHAALTYSTAIEQRVLASNIAERQMAKLRGWSHSPVGAGYGFDDWSGNLNRSFPDEEHPEFTVTITSETAPLISPNSLLQSDQNLLQRSAQKVQVRVASPRVSTTLVSLVADPTRRLRSTNPLDVEVVGGVTRLSRDETCELKVTAYDRDDREIPDLVYRWFLEPLSGNATILDAEGPTTKVRNVYGLDQNIYTGGACRVRVLAVYRGESAWAVSDTIDLDP